MPELPDALGQDAFHTLVHQFTHELSFYRELIQNSIDAGSHQVDVSTVYEDGTAVVSVRDYGEGMDRRIIDDELTTLFVSHKHGDLTQVGKFGVGFVSVFALAPQAVVVDTGRHGEAWRVIFQASGDFERHRLDEAFEGTLVRVLKPMDARAYATFVRQSQETIEYWCRHCPADVVFNGHPLNAPFDIDAGVKMVRDVPGTRLVVAAAPPFYGFYRGGITLMETTELPARLQGERWLDGVAFKMDSRYLEHTITRDTIRFDDQFDKALAVLRDTVCNGLVEEMYRRLAENWDRPECAPQVRRTLRGEGRSVRFMPRVGAGSPCSLADLEAAPSSRLVGPEVVFFAADSGRLTDLIERQGVPVLRHVDWLQETLKAVRVDVATPDRLLVAPVPTADVAGALRLLLDAAVSMLRRAGFRPPPCGWGTWAPGPLCAAGPGRTGLSMVGVAPGWGQALLVNAADPLVARLGRLGQQDLDAAAQVLARVMAEALGRTRDLDGRLSRV